MSFFSNLLSARFRRAPTRAQWFSNQQNLLRLREIIIDPVFIGAVNHLLDESRISDSDITNRAPLLPLLAARQAGYATFIKDLELLAQAPAVMQNQQIAEWDYDAELA